MGTFKAYFKKEYLEALRQYRYIVLAAGILFFSITDPIMQKLLPSILKSQIHGDLAALFVTNRRIVMQSYVKNLFQLGLMFVIFTAASSLSDEITNKKLVFPYAKGGSPKSIVLAKLLHYSITVTILTICGFIINSYYTNILFKNDSVSFMNVMVSACQMSLYYIFNIILVIFFSSYFKKGIAAGFAAVGISYFSVVLDNIKSIREFLPYRLVSNASSFNNPNSIKVICFAAICSIILIVLTINRMNRVEVV